MRELTLNEIEMVSGGSKKKNQNSSTGTFGGYVLDTGIGMVHGAYKAFRIVGPTAPELLPEAIAAGAVFGGIEASVTFAMKHFAMDYYLMH